MKSFYFLMAMAFSVNSSAFVNAKATPKEVINAVIEAQMRSELECTLSDNSKRKLKELAISAVMNQVSKPIVKVNEVSAPHIIITGAQDKYDSEVNMEVVTTSDFKDIQKMKVERYTWQISRVNVGTITNPRFEEVRTKKYLENINCQ